MELTDKYANGLYSNEAVAICGLLHDVCKVQFYKKGFRNVKDDTTGQWIKKDVYEIDEKFCGGHSQKSVILLQAFIKLEVDVIYAILGHMGGFDNEVKAGGYLIGNIFEKSTLAPLMHVADLIASYINEAKKE